VLQNLPNKKAFSVFSNFLIKKGKAHLKEKITYKLLCFIKLEQKKGAVLLINQFLKKARALIHFKNICINGSFFKVPFFLQGENQIKKGLKFFLNDFNKKTSLTIFFVNRLKNNTFLEKRNSFLRSANKNKIFAFYRWF